MFFLFFNNYFFVILFYLFGEIVIMFCFNFGFNKKFIPILGLFIVLCLSMSIVNATNIVNNSGDHSNVYFDSYYQYNLDHISNNSYNVSSEDDFKKVFDYVKSFSDVPKHVNINIMNNIKVKGSNILSIDSKDTTFEINGNGHTVKVSNPKDNDEKHFLTCGSESNVFIKNLNLSGFNNAIINKGILDLKNVTFDSNRLDYWIFEDYGGAIRNKGGELSCTNCNFIGNVAKYGGAIYLDKNTQAEINDCYFIGNYGYSQGNDIYHGRNAKVYINGTEICC